MATLGNSSFATNTDYISNFGSLVRYQATESGTITAIENYISVPRGRGTYRPVIYRGTSSGPTTLAYYAASDITVISSGVSSHSLPSAIFITNGEYLWFGARLISNTALNYAAATGIYCCDVSPFNDPVPNPCIGFSVFSDTRYASALIYDPATGVIGGYSKIEAKYPSSVSVGLSAKTITSRKL